MEGNEAVDVNAASVEGLPLAIQLSPESRDKKGILSNHSHLMSFAPSVIRSTRASISPRHKKVPNKSENSAYISPRARAIEALASKTHAKPKKIPADPVAKGDPVLIQEMYNSLATLSVEHFAPAKPKILKQSSKRPVNAAYHRVPEHDGDNIKFSALDKQIDVFGRGVIWTAPPFPFPEFEAGLFPGYRPTFTPAKGAPRLSSRPMYTPSGNPPATNTGTLAANTGDQPAWARLIANPTKHASTKVSISDNNEGLLTIATGKVLHPEIFGTLPPNSHSTIEMLPISFILQEFFGTCYSAELRICSTLQPWFIFMPANEVTAGFDRIRKNLPRLKDDAAFNFTNWFLNAITIKHKEDKIFKAKFDDIHFLQNVHQYVESMKHSAIVRIQAIARGKYARNLVNSHKNKMQSLAQSRLNAIERIRAAKFKKHSSAGDSSNKRLLGGQLDLDAYFQAQTEAIDVGNSLFGTMSVSPSVAESAVEDINQGTSPTIAGSTVPVPSDNRPEGMTKFTTSDSRNISAQTATSPDRKTSSAVDASSHQSDSADGSAQPFYQSSKIILKIIDQTPKV